MKKSKKMILLFLLCPLFIGAQQNSSTDNQLQQIQQQIIQMQSQLGRALQQLQQQIEQVQAQQIKMTALLNEIKQVDEWFVQPTPLPPQPRKY